PAVESLVRRMRIHGDLFSDVVRPAGQSSRRLWMRIRGEDGSCLESFCDPPQLADPLRDLHRLVDEAVGGRPITIFERAVAELDQRSRSEMEVAQGGVLVESARIQ